MIGRPRQQIHTVDHRGIAGRELGEGSLIDLARARHVATNESDEADAQQNLPTRLMTTADLFVSNRSASLEELELSAENAETSARRRPNRRRLGVAHQRRL